MSQGEREERNSIVCLPAHRLVYPKLRRENEHPEGKGVCVCVCAPAGSCSHVQVQNSSSAHIDHSEVLRILLVHARFRRGHGIVALVTFVDALEESVFIPSNGYRRAW